MDKFVLKSEYKPTGDQPQAIEALVKGFEEGNQCQTLLGVTGSGKTFTMANIISQVNLPTLVLAHNKTLAAQLYTEFKALFPENAVRCSKNFIAKTFQTGNTMAVSLNSLNTITFITTLI